VTPIIFKYTGSLKSMETAKYFQNGLAEVFFVVTVGFKKKTGTVRKSSVRFYYIFIVWNGLKKTALMCHCQTDINGQIKFPISN
jgi:hypothetical protein